MYKVAKNVDDKKPFGGIYIVTMYHVVHKLHACLL